MNVLSLKGVSVGERIQAVDITFARGSLVGLVGPNGSGKSTLLQAAAAVLPYSGSVLWNEKPVPTIDPLERGRLSAWVPQEAHFEFGFPVRSVVAQGRFAHGDDDVGVDEALRRLDLESLAHRPVNRLSGGERQRVLLARALTTRAPLQLWDEPLASLDPRHALEVLLLARELANGGHTVVISLHDLRIAHCLDHVVVMNRGRIHASGKPDSVLTPSLLLEVFGVQASLQPGLTLRLP